MDDFLRVQVSNGLGPGEQVLGFGHVRQPQRFSAVGVPQLYVHWLAVATSSRLILFAAEAGGVFEGAPRPAQRDTLVWCYDELARVELGAVAGLNLHAGGQPMWFRLVPLPLAGPGSGDTIRYDVFPAADGLDDQQRFMTSFPNWLAQQVAAGAFPMRPEKRAAMEARVTQRGAEIAAQRENEIARMRRQEEAIQKALPTVLRIGAAIGLAGLFLVSAIILVRAIGLHAEYSEALDRNPNDEYAGKMVRTSIVRALGGGAGLVLAPAAALGLFLLDRHRRRRAVQSAAASS